MIETGYTYIYLLFNKIYLFNGN